MYTWTEKKNKDNKQKHGFYFSEVLDVFNVTHSLEFYDEIHSSLDEDRYIFIGCLHDGIILSVVTTDKKNGDTQIISARMASPKEEEAYHEHYSREVGGN
jgi:uncharacterized DUF497 family protein